MNSLISQVELDPNLTTENVLCTDYASGRTAPVRSPLQLAGHRVLSVSGFCCRQRKVTRWSASRLWVYLSTPYGQRKCLLVVEKGAHSGSQRLVSRSDVLL